MPNANKHIMSPLRGSDGLHFRSFLTTFQPPHMRGVRRTRLRVLFALACLALSLETGASQEGSCPSLEADLLSYFDKQSACTADTECTTYTACPIGCYRSINKSSVEDVEAKVTAYRESCGFCVYGCAAKGYRAGEEAPQVKCIRNTCQWSDEVNDLPAS